MRAAWATVFVALVLAFVGGFYIGQHGDLGITIMILVDAVMLAALAVNDARNYRSRPGGQAWPDHLGPATPPRFS